MARNVQALSRLVKPILGLHAAALAAASNLINVELIALGIFYCGGNFLRLLSDLRRFDFAEYRI
jgi:hypothetical protein